MSTPMVTVVGERIKTALDNIAKANLKATRIVLTDSTWAKLRQEIRGQTSMELGAHTNGVRYCGVPVELELCSDYVVGTTPI